MPMLYRLIENSPLVEKNYLGVDIPNSMGLVFLFTPLLSLGIMSIFYPIEDLFIFLFGLYSIGLLGFLDDTIGTDEYKGLKGHIGQFFKGNLTSGNIKASLGFFIALLITIYNQDKLYLTNALIIALTINFHNLLDLRPGRVSKAFIIISIIVILISKTSKYNYILITLLGAILFYINKDLKAQLMMGDTGSNILGFSLGYYIMMSLGDISKFIILTLLIAIHIYTEKFSLTETIENIKILNFLDKLGR